MGTWRKRFTRARRYGVGQAVRAAIAYRLHDATVLNAHRSSMDVGRLVGCGQHPLVLPTADPGRTSGWQREVLSEGISFQPGRITSLRDSSNGISKIPAAHLPHAVTLGVRRLVVQDATITPGQSLIVTSRAALVPELLDRVDLGQGRWEPGPATCISPWRKRSGGGKVDALTLHRMRTRTATLWRASDAHVRIPRAITLFETVDDHFGHGMLDLLHRLRAIEGVPISWPILVSNRMPQTIVSWLRIIAPGRKILRCVPGRIIHVDSLIVPLESARLWQSPLRVDQASLVPATIDPHAMRWLQSLGALKRQGDRRVWIRRDRSPHSLIEGESKLVESARSFGFEDVFLQDLSFQQAQQLMSEVSHVIAPMASAVANLVLAQPGVRVLQLTDDLTWLDHYGSLTWLGEIGHHSELLVGRRSRDGSYTVSSQALAEAIRRLLETQTL